MSITQHQIEPAAVSDEDVAKFVEVSAKIISGSPVPSARSYAKARQIADAALESFAKRVQVGGEAVVLPNELLDRLRHVIDFADGICTTNEAASKSLGWIMQYGRVLLSALSTAANPGPQAVPEGMCLVTKEDGNNYCRILTALGMEEEGDPVAEVEALLAMRERLGPEPAAVQYTSQQAAREIRGSIIRRLEGFNEAYPQHWCGFLDDALGAAEVIADRLAAKGEGRA